jgi:hypothetical protein
MEPLKEGICMFREQNVTVVESSFHECKPGRHKLTVKVVDLFGNDNQREKRIRFKLVGNSKKYKYTELLMAMLVVLFWQAINHYGTVFIASPRA